MGLRAVGADVGLRAVGRCGAEGDVGQLWGSSGAAVLPLSPPHSCPPRAPPLALLLLALPLLALPGGLGKPTAWQERARPGTAQQHEDAPSFQYDHEAFLGKEEARSFDQLSPEESQERLG